MRYSRSTLTVLVLAVLAVALTFTLQGFGGASAETVDEPTPTTEPPPTTETTLPPPPPPPPVTLMGAGDVCDVKPAGCAATAALVMNHNPSWVAMLGDMQYPEASPTTVAAGYNINWGPFKDKTLPVLGNHEFKNNIDTTYCTYFAAAASCPTHQYIKELGGNWVLIGLDSNGSITSAKVAQFNALLDQAAGKNVIVAWHHPQYSSPCTGCHTPKATMKAFMSVAVARGVDVLLTSHDHKYESFDRMGAAGPLDTGIPMFLVGTGGAHQDPGCSSRTSGSRFCGGGAEATKSRATVYGTANNLSVPGLRGMVKLTLKESDFNYEYVQADGSTMGISHDSGTFATR